MKLTLPKPVNATQEEFQKLCELGGGQAGGPVRHKVFELLRSSGKKLNANAYEVALEHMEAAQNASVWHVCFSVGLCWGHLAKAEPDFTRHVVRAIADLDDSEMKAATSYHYERGPEPIEQSIRGARMLFEMVTLPDQLPSSLEALGQVQDRWLGPILGPKRPRYIGSWNATAMFMVALFMQPELAATQKKPRPVLPPGGPIFAGLKLLYQGKLLSGAPDGSDLDDAGFEPGVLFVNNNLLAELSNQIDDCSLLDIHSGLYMLGTRHLQSKNWI